MYTNYLLAFFATSFGILGIPITIYDICSTFLDGVQPLQEPLVSFAGLGYYFSVISFLVAGVLFIFWIYDEKLDQCDEQVAKFGGGDNYTNIVQDSLTDKIQRQDRLITELQTELQLSRQSSVCTLLGQLRLREAVLLYVGHDTDSFEKQITESFGCDVAQAISHHLFILDKAPIPPEVQEEIRKAVNHGMTRW